MARSTQPPPPFDAKLTAEQMQSGISRLQKRVDELEQFDLAQIRESGNPSLNALETSIEATLSAVFGNRTVQYQRYFSASQIDYHVFSWDGPDPGEVQQRVRRNHAHALETLKQAIRDLNEELDHIPPPREILPAAKSKIDPKSKKVFVVHGRDNDAKNEVARFLEKIGLTAIILHERPNKGRHLLTKFQEEAAEVAFVVVLLTPDDVGGLSDKELQPRARQNVIFELGFFIGKMGADRVAALVRGDVEKPSDFDGVAYVPIDAGGGWKGILARELHAAQIPFDPIKVLEA